MATHINSQIPTRINPHRFGRLWLLGVFVLLSSLPLAGCARSNAQTSRAPSVAVSTRPAADPVLPTTLPPLTLPPVTATATPTARPTATLTATFTVTPMPSPPGAPATSTPPAREEPDAASMDSGSITNTLAVTGSSTITGIVAITSTTGVTDTVIDPIDQLVLQLARPLSSTGTLTVTSSLTEADGLTDAPAEWILVPTPQPVTTDAEPATPNPGPTPDGVARTVQVPILMYHYLSVPPADADIYRRDLSVAPERFAAQLDAIRDAGYTTISLYTLLAYLVQGTALPDKPVIITFDDGYRDNYDNAFPALAQRDMTATFFVVTDFIDEQRPAYFSWEMLREMLAAGMSIESHGRNHVSLAGKEDDYLVWQALGSMETIEYELGQRPRFVSYPAGDYDQKTLDIFASANYWAGLTTVQGATHSNKDLFQLHRVRVRGDTSPEELVRLLSLDW